jgi:preprotein translocase subunit SecA
MGRHGRRWKRVHESSKVEPVAYGKCFPGSIRSCSTRTITSTEQESQSSRNDPCPCKSGKKYKKCHGAPTP